MAALSEEAVSPLLPNATDSSSQRRGWKKILVEREENNVHAIRMWYHIFHDERQICVAWRDPGLVSSASRLGRISWPRRLGVAGDASSSAAACPKVVTAAATPVKEPVSPPFPPVAVIHVKVKKPSSPLQPFTPSPHVICLSSAQRVQLSIRLLFYRYRPNPFTASNARLPLTSTWCGIS
ncbi:MAG: hypothetical protein LQ345_004686 [Seirophora villosa]|nr:MAG: hypothetical protein LQ345_004686 [Seirophora villosa]